MGRCVDVLVPDEATATAAAATTAAVAVADVDGLTCVMAFFRDGGGVVTLWGSRFKNKTRVNQTSQTKSAQKPQKISLLFVLLMNGGGGA